MIFFSFSIDHKEELKKLNISLLFNFLELIDMLIKNPQLYPKKLEEIKTILINMHHLMNTYRPHQARQILIEILQTQVQRKQLLLNAMDSYVQSIFIISSCLIREREREKM
jgi:mediator of RNA polymerase II transcription subunit 7